MFSTESWRCDREEPKRSLNTCKNLYFNCPVRLSDKLDFYWMNTSWVRTVYWRGEDKGWSNLINKCLVRDPNNKTAQHHKQNHNEPYRISTIQEFYLSLKQISCIETYWMHITKKGKNRAKSGMNVLRRVFALRRFRQSALCVQRIATHINNSGNVQRQGLHIVLHRSHDDRKAQRVLRKQNTNCFTGNVCWL